MKVETLAGVTCMHPDMHSSIKRVNIQSKMIRLRSVKDSIFTSSRRRSCRRPALHSTASRWSPDTHVYACMGLDAR